MIQLALEPPAKPKRQPRKPWVFPFPKNWHPCEWTEKGQQCGKLAEGPSRMCSEHYVPAIERGWKKRGSGERAGG